LIYYLHKVYFYGNIRLFVTAKSDQNTELIQNRMDPHWFGSLDPEPDQHSEGREVEVEGGGAPGAHITHVMPTAEQALDLLSLVSICSV
jgi:hypothetical protein